MGSGVIMVWDLMLLELSKSALVLLFLGALFYLVGIAFFLLGEYKPIYHVVWHIFVIIAACLHWFCIYFFILHVDIEDSPTRAAVSDLVDSVSAAADLTASIVNRTLNY
jgi:glucan phosphoethanolaminetransferase (alkaline phosphatase superfamily)